jgi:peptidase E
MEKITDEELKEIQGYYQKEAETTATIGRLTTELYLLQDRTRQIETELSNIKTIYVTDNKNQFLKLQALLKKYNATEINQSTGELSK